MGPGEPLRIGVPGSQRPARDPIRAVVQAEDAGFDSIWWADRLMGWLPEGPHALLDPFPLMAAAAVATKRILLGTAVTDPLRRHPAQLAQTALTLQHLSRSRLVLGVGCGEVAGTRPYGISYDRPVSRLEDALEVLRRLWADGHPVSYDGPFFSLDRAVCGLAASVDPPPVWVAAHGPRTLRLTGTVADGWLPTAYGPDAYRDGLTAVRAAEATAGRRRGAVEAGVFLWMVVAESRDRARALLRENDLRALGLLLPQGALARTPLPEGPWASLVPTDPRTAELVDGVDPDELGDVLPIGSPDDVADEIARYVAAGAKHIVLCDMAPVARVDTGLGLRPLEVHAAVRDRLAQRVMSP